MRRLAMGVLDDCLQANREWAARMVAQEPGFFTRLKVQNPDLLWIGCSDSRLPPNEIIGRAPGEVFVHRNVSNIVEHSDMNCLSVLQFAVDVLEVKHVIIVGHYGCGGIKSAMQPKSYGLIDTWLRHIRDISRAHHDELEAITDPDRRAERLVELNVQTQVANVSHTTIVQAAWARGQKLSIHGWIYSLADGLLHPQGDIIRGLDQIDPEYRLFA